MPFTQTIARNIISNPQDFSKTPWIFGQAFKVASAAFHGTGGEAAKAAPNPNRVVETDELMPSTSTVAQIRAAIAAKGLNG